MHGIILGMRVCVCVCVCICVCVGGVDSVTGFIISTACGMHIKERVEFVCMRVRVRVALLFTVAASHTFTWRTPPPSKNGNTAVLISLLEVKKSHKTHSVDDR